MPRKTIRTLIASTALAATLACAAAPALADGGQPCRGCPRPDPVISSPITCSSDRSYFLFTGAPDKTKGGSYGFFSAIPDDVVAQTQPGDWVLKSYDNETLTDPEAALLGVRTPASNAYDYIREDVQGVDGVHATLLWNDTGRLLSLNHACQGVLSSSFNLTIDADTTDPSKLKEVAQAATSQLRSQMVNAGPLEGITVNPDLFKTGWRDGHMYLDQTWEATSLIEPGKRARIVSVDPVERDLVEGVEARYRPTMVLDQTYRTVNWTGQVQHLEGDHWVDLPKTPWPVAQIVPWLNEGVILTTGPEGADPSDRRKIVEWQNRSQMRFMTPEDLAAGAWDKAVTIHSTSDETQGNWMDAGRALGGLDATVPVGEARGKYLRRYALPDGEVERLSRVVGRNLTPVDLIDDDGDFPGAIPPPSTTPKAPTSAGALPEQPGVAWETGLQCGITTVTAAPKDGFLFTPGSQTSWEFGTSTVPVARTGQGQPLRPADTVTDGEGMTLTWGTEPDWNQPGEQAGTIHVQDADCVVDVPVTVTVEAAPTPRRRRSLSPTPDTSTPEVTETPSVTPSPEQTATTTPAPEGVLAKTGVPVWMPLAAGGAVLLIGAGTLILIRRANS